VKPPDHAPNQPPNHQTTKPPTSLFILHPSLSIFLFYSLLTLILTHPLIFNLASAVPNDIGDPLLNTWILAWDIHALLANPLNLFQANIFYPLPNTLAYSEHLFSSALLAAPLQLITGEPVVTYNVSLLLTFPLAAFGMYLLAKHLTGIDGRRLARTIRTGRNNRTPCLAQQRQGYRVVGAANTYRIVSVQIPENIGLKILSLDLDALPIKHKDYGQGTRPGIVYELLRP